jgi:transposase InsO family protein
MKHTSKISGKKPNKSQLAKEAGVSRSTLYYKAKRDGFDQEMKKQIEIVLGLNPSYGHKRIALEFKLNKKRILRIMKKFGIKPYRQQPRFPKKPEDYGKPKTKWKNEIIGICPIKPNVVWASDFTYLKFQGYFIYLATIIDVYSREIIGWNISNFHDTDLILGALRHAIKRTGKTPIYLHSDQGSEYDSRRYEEYAKSNGILISMSAKGSPWENGFQESFYSQFKVDLSYVSRFEAVEQLIEEIYQTLYYYNNQRIHTSLEMAPISFRYIYEQRLVRQSV